MMTTKAAPKRSRGRRSAVPLLATITNCDVVEAVHPRPPSDACTTPLRSSPERRRRCRRPPSPTLTAETATDRIILPAVPLILLFLVSTVTVVHSQTTSMTAITNGRVYTMNPATNNPWAEAVAYDDDTGIITAVGTNAEIRSFLSEHQNNTIKEVDVGGRLVLPGFVDAHVHAVESGINSMLCEIPPDAPPTDVPCYLLDCPDGGSFGDQGWIVGTGVDVGMLMETLDMDPTMEYPIVELDDAYPNTPVLILDDLGHAALANTAAISIVGYDTLEGDPPGGIIGRDPITRELTGIVYENAQQKLRDAAFPPSDVNQQIAYEGLLYALDEFARYGVTTVSDAGGFYRQAQTETWERAESEGTLSVRASNALYVYPEVPIMDQISEFTSRFGGDDTDRLARFDRAKIYVDGILSLGTAALYEPYLSSMCLPQGEARGFEYFGDADTLNSVSQTLVSEGYQLHYHTVGDRAVGLALDAIEHVQQSYPQSGPHRLTHNYLIDESDRARFVELGVVADFQLSPRSTSKEYVDFMTYDVIGEDRSSRLLPAVELYEMGATLTLSSDWDADSLNPLTKIRAVLSRERGTSFDTVEQVLPLMTINPARLLGRDDVTGSIEVGKEADLIVLDGDIFDVPVEEIDDAIVLVTLLAGEVVYDPTNVMGGGEVGEFPPDEEEKEREADYWYDEQHSSMDMDGIVSSSASSARSGSGADTLGLGPRFFRGINVSSLVVVCLSLLLFVESHVDDSVLGLLS